MSRLIRINPRDNVAVALEPLKSGESALGVTLREDIPAGHKFALCDIAENENVVKYGFPIGHATQPIPAGQLGAYPQCQDQSFRPAGIQLPSASLRHAR